MSMGCARCTHPVYKEEQNLSVYGGDFLGFQLGDYHSTGLNIIRVTASDRYNDALVPNFTDETVQVPGGNGTYYFDSHDSTKQIQVDFAFDELTDSQLTMLRNMFGYKGLRKLIFDEKPDRYYMVRPTQPPVLSYVPFSGPAQTIIYKGEGSVQFVAYYPYALGLESIQVGGSGITTNPGDLSASLELIYELPLSSGVQITVTHSGTDKTFKMRNTSAYEGDTHILINPRTQLIEGLQIENGVGVKTGHLYNKYITHGDFVDLMLEPGNSNISSIDSESQEVNYYSAKYVPVYY